MLAKCCCQDVLACSRDELQYRQVANTWTANRKRTLSLLCPSSLSPDQDNGRDTDSWALPDYHTHGKNLLADMH